ncbi:MAG TPA: manganese efflux pump MntP family protein [Clostridia bacterium]|nr:manganese efflux pump MntP family protein [Clostridia bacterium]
MHGWELLALAIGLSMDACAVSVCKGLAIRTFRLRNAILVGLYFGVFQALMPLVGYFLGIQFADRIAFIDHWIAFVLLGFLGVKMIREANDHETCEANATLRVGHMLLLAIATSIDALAVGITFAFLQVSILPAVTMIGATTFCICLLGVWVGHCFGLRFKSRAELFGGFILIGMGLKILLEHTILA